MRIRNAIILTTAFGLFTLKTAGQSNDSISFPHGKPHILVFINVNSSFNREGISPAFEITRGYLGYEHNFSRTLSSKVILDVGDPGTGELQMTAFVKNAFLKYAKNNFTASVGMIGTDQFKVQEKHWGYRYILKSLQDEYGIGPSADLGAAIEYTLSDVISFDVSLLNGEGYKRVQSDSALKASAGITVNPLEGLVLRGYYDYMRNDAVQATISLFAGYTYGIFRAGLEYDKQQNHRMQDQNDLNGVSAWAALQLNKKFSVFTRFDYLWSEVPGNEAEPRNLENDGKMYVAGMDFSPVKGVRIAPVWMGWSPSDRADLFTSKTGLWFEIRF
jgi:hypothetical protein